MVEAWDLPGLLRCVDSSGLRLGSMPKSLTALIFSFKSPSAFWSSSVAVCWIGEAPTPPGTVATRGGESSTVNRETRIRSTTTNAATATFAAGWRRPLENDVIASPGRLKRARTLGLCVGRPSPGDC